MTTIADDYSATGAAWQAGPGRVYDVLAERAVADAPVVWQGRLVVDVGAGTGAASRAIARAGGRPIALDAAAGMLAAIAPPRPPSAVTDARRLPLRTSSVDGLVAAFCLNHVPDPHRALAEGVRVVRAGGPIVVSSYAADDGHPVRAAVEAAATEAGWRRPPWIDEMRATATPLLATVAGSLGQAARAGAGGASATHVSVAFPDLNADDLVAWRLGMAQLAPFVQSLDAGSLLRLRQRALELLGEPPPLVRRVVVLTICV